MKLLVFDRYHMIEPILQINFADIDEPIAADISRSLLAYTVGEKR